MMGSHLLPGIGNVFVAMMYMSQLAMGRRIARQITSSGIIDTALHTNLTIINRTRRVKVIATTYGPNVDIYCIKYDFEDKLK